jgi:Arc/MetJ-type ribon-helix-helix transcriptional regulator
MHDVRLPADLERFTAGAIAPGHYRHRAEMVRAGLSLLRDPEADVAAFVAMLEAAQAEDERRGVISAADVEAEMTATLDQHRMAPVHENGRAH